MAMTRKQRKGRRRRKLGIVLEIIGLLLVLFGVVSDPSEIGIGIELAKELETAAGLVAIIAGELTRRWGKRDEES